MNIYSLIMAGGGGARFWPLSRVKIPKQVLNFSGNDIMLNETIKRHASIIPYSKTFIVTNETQKENLEKVLIPEIPRKNIFIETEVRNTAPCIIYSAIKIIKEYGDGIMCVFPSDHSITNEVEYLKILGKAINLASGTQKLVTIGITPNFASIGYGYIKYAKNVPVGDGYEVKEFVEKPEYDEAKKYVQSGDYLWNSGIFVWKVSIIIENFRRFLPKIFDKIHKIKNYINTSEENKHISEIYSQLQNISIDYGILERSNDVLVIPGDFGWSDVGTWDALYSIFPPDENGNIIKGDHLSLDTRNCIIYGNNALIATVGLENMIIVNVNDATLVCSKDKAQDVKKLVELLRKGNRTELL